jgi:hypothetical protein
LASSRFARRNGVNKVLGMGGIRLWLGSAGFSAAWISDRQ